MNRTGPNFIVIGPGKSGTTWVYNALRAHPEVCVSSVKETLFFNEYYDRGVEWYERHFSHCGAARAVGEVSNTYIFSAQAAEHIHDYDPSIKLISTLRNPVDRTFSHYLFLLRNGEFSVGFEDALVRRPDLVERGFYRSLLDRYLEHFSREQILLLMFDDLRADPKGYAERLFGFLEVDATFFAEGLEKKRLAASKARSRLVARLVKKASVLARDAGLGQLVNTVKESRLPKLLYKPYSDTEYPAMQADTRKRLEDVFLREVERLSELAGRDLVALWFGGDGRSIAGRRGPVDG